MVIPKPIKNSRSTWTSRYSNSDLTAQEMINQEKNKNNFGKTYKQANTKRLQNNANKIDQKSITQSILNF